MVRELYVANNITSLDVLAMENSVVKNIKGKKRDFLYKSAKACLKNIYNDVSDEEMTYVLIKRFLYITDKIYNIEENKSHFNLMFNKSIQETKSQLITLRKSLEKRYDQRLDSYKMDVVPVPEITNSPTKLNFFGNDPFVGCKEVYEVFRTNPNLMLIIDVRSANDFNESHLKGFNIINISEECITTGLSAHILGSKLANEAQKLFEKRDYFEYIILIDWDSTQKTFISTKLHILRDILTLWDVNKNYKNPPYVLNGGYVEFIDMYPTLSTNSHIVYTQKYSELDELLDLDAIQYPSEDTGINTSSIQTKIEKPPNVDELVDLMLNITNKLLKIEEQLLNNQSKIFDLEKKISNENCQGSKLIENKEMLDEELNELENSKIMYDERKNIIGKQLDALLATTGAYDDAWKYKKAEIENIEIEICQLVLKRKKLIENEKYLTLINEVTPERQPDEIKGRPSAGDTPETVNKHAIKKPEINRSTKPVTPILSVRSTEPCRGLIGLVNIRNTCYMNTIIQCFRHVPTVKKFFCDGAYNYNISRKEPVIIFETAQLVRNLWTIGSIKHLRPLKFYNKIGAINPVFQEGHHEDCTEFFMLLLNCLNEDCAEDVARLEKYNLAKHEAWYYRLGNKRSFFIDNFYHQIRLSLSCEVCNKKCQKYELESTFMLSVPEKPEFKVESLMERYLSSQEGYRCSICNVEIRYRKDISYQPQIAVIVLKRYKFEKGVLHKKQNACSFPLNNFKIGRGIYKLWSIAMHQGTMQSGHYTAACLNPFDGNWYEYNDEIVSHIQMDSQAVKEKVYMLFYELVNSTKGFDNL